MREMVLFRLFEFKKMSKNARRCSLLYFLRTDANRRSESESESESESGSEKDLFTINR